MGKKKRKNSDAIAGQVIITAMPDGTFGFEVESDLSPEVLAVVLRSAADAVSGRVNRAAGAWGG